MTDFGLKIAKNGQSVKTARDSDVVFSTLFKTMPVSQVLRLEYSLAAGDAIRRTVKHGLKFVPFYLIFYKASSFSDRWIWYPQSGAGILTNGGELVLSDRVDKENISFLTLGNGSTAGTLDVALVIFNFPIALSV